MPRRKRRDNINEYHLGRIERQVSLLETVIEEATLSLKAFCPHHEALIQLRKGLVVAVNLLSGRPADYFRHSGHMSPEQAAWHSEFERKARAEAVQGDDVDEADNGALDETAG